MSAIATTTELRSMQIADLRHELAAHRAIVRKMRLGIHMSKEKDTAKYRREKKALARMTAVMGEKEKEALQKPKRPRRVPAS